MRKISSSVSDEDLEKIKDGESLLDIAYDNSRWVPRSCCNDNETKIGFLFDSVISERKSKISKSQDKCIFGYDAREKRFFLCHLIGKSYKMDVIYISGSCCYFWKSASTEEPINSIDYCYDIPIDFYNKIKSMVMVCGNGINRIMQDNLSRNNQYDKKGLDKYCNVYKKFCSNSDYIYNDNSDEIKEMSVSEFDNKLSEYNTLVDVTLKKMVGELTDEFIKKHRYIIMDNGSHNYYKICRFDKFFIVCVDNDKEYGYIKQYLTCDCENLGYYTPIDFNSDSGCKIEYSTFFPCLALSGFNTDRIYFLTDDSLGDRLFDNYKSIYNKVSEMYDNLSKVKLI